MKWLLMIAIVFGLHGISNAQEVSVEKSIWGVQTGFTGIWVHNEARLSNLIALRSEVGLDRSVSGGNIYDYSQVGFFLSPVITVEPRWYYNLNKRNSKSKITSGNSGNYVSIKSSFNPDWLVNSSHENIELINQISIIPSWGIRRNLGKHFNYEAGIGLGYTYLFAKSNGFAENEGVSTLDLHLRIGYQF